MLLLHKHRREITGRALSTEPKVSDPSGRSQKRRRQGKSDRKGDQHRAAECGTEA